MSALDDLLAPPKKKSALDALLDGDAPAPDFSAVSGGASTLAATPTALDTLLTPQPPDAPDIGAMGGLPTSQITDVAGLAPVSDVQSNLGMLGGVLPAAADALAGLVGTGLRAGTLGMNNQLASLYEQSPQRQAISNWYKNSQQDILGANTGSPAANAIGATAAQLAGGALGGLALPGGGLYGGAEQAVAAPAEAAVERRIGPVRDELSNEMWSLIRKGDAAPLSPAETARVATLRSAIQAKMASIPPEALPKIGRSATPDMLGPVVGQPAMPVEDVPSDDRDYREAGAWPWSGYAPPDFTPEQVASRTAAAPGWLKHSTNNDLLSKWASGEISDTMAAYRALTRTSFMKDAAPAFEVSSGEVRIRPGEGRLPDERQPGRHMDAVVLAFDNALSELERTPGGPAAEPSAHFEALRDQYGRELDAQRLAMENVVRRPYAPVDAAAAVLHGNAAEQAAAASNIPETPGVGKVIEDIGSDFPFQHNIGPVTDLAPDAMSTLRQVAADHSTEFMAQRARGFTDAELQSAPAELADRLGMTVEAFKKTPVGSTLNEGQTVALASMTKSALSQFTDLTARIAAGDNSDLNRAAAATALDDFTALFKVSVGAASEGARALRARQLAVTGMSAGDYLARRVMQHYGSSVTDDMIKTAVEAATTGGDQAVANVMRGLSKASWKDLPQYLMLSSALSSPATVVKKFIGESAMLLGGEGVVRPLAATLSTASRAIFNTEQTQYLGEVLPAWHGVANGMTDGLSRALNVITKGYNYEPGGMLMPAGNVLDNSSNAFVRNVVSPAISYGLRGIKATTVFMQALSHSAEAYAEAARSGIRLGLSGADLDEHIANKVANMTSDPEMLAVAQRYAERNTFSDQPSELARGLREGVLNKIKVGDYPIGNFIQPFMNALDRLIVRGFEFTPLGLLRPLSKYGREQFAAHGADLTARAAVGSVGMFGAALLAARGNLTGPAPTDAGEREAFYAQGLQPYSLRLGGPTPKAGDWVVPFSSLEPINTALMLVSAWHDSWQRGNRQSQKEGLASAPTSQQIIAALGADANAITEKAYFAGLQDVLDAVKSSKPGDWKGAYQLGIRQATATVIPSSAMLRSIAGASDPRVLHNETASEQVMAGIPGMSQQVPSRTDSFGSPVLRSTARFKTPDNMSQVLANMSAVSGTPLAATQVKFDPVYQALTEAGIDPHTSIDVFTVRPGEKEHLDATQKDQALRLAGPDARAGIEQRIKDPQWWLLSKDKKAQILNSIMEQARARARKGMILQARSM